MKKKILCLLLSSLILLTSCGSKKNNRKQNGADISGSNNTSSDNGSNDNSGDNGSNDTSDNSDSSSDDSENSTLPDVSHLSWKVEGDTLIISGQGEIPDFELDDIESMPWHENLSQINEIIISEGITRIGNYSLSTNEANISIPKSVTSIGDCAFIGAYGVEIAEGNENFVFENGTLFTKDKKTLIYKLPSEDTTYSIPDTVTKISGGAFTHSEKLSFISIPSSVTHIGDYAFYHCHSLTSISIPNSVTHIGDYAFSMCYSLTSISIPNSVTYIGDKAFYYCHNLTEINVASQNKHFTSESGILFTKDKKTLICYPGGKEGFSYSIPDGVTHIGDGAFEHCASLTSISIPNSVTHIGDGAFLCDNLTEIDVDSQNKNFTSENGILFTKDKKTLICYPQGKSDTSYSIPSGVTHIGNSAFYHCKSLTSISIPNSVTHIGDSAFLWCEAIASISIPNSVTHIGDWAFSMCVSLSSVSIPNSVTHIGDYAFYYCESLASISIPNSVTHIGDWAFCHCDSITSVSIPSSVTHIGNRAFSGCKSLASVSIPNSVTHIGNYAFYWCSPLASISIPNSVTHIGDHAFDRCASLTSISIPNSVTHIGDGAFSCINLTEINVDSQNKNFTSENGILFTKDKKTIICYPQGKSDTSYSIPSSVTHIGNGAFYNCRYLTSISIPNSVTHIGGWAFLLCGKLTEINVDSQNKHFASENGVLFTKDKKTLIYYPIGKDESSYSIPDGVTHIENYVFCECGSLTSVSIPNSVTYIGDKAFVECHFFSTINFGGTKEQWESISYDGTLNFDIICTDGTISK